MDEAILSQASRHYDGLILIRRHLEELFQRFPEALHLKFGPGPDHNGGQTGNNLLSVCGCIPVPRAADGSVYWIPIAIRLLPDYPWKAPICSIVPTSDMSINESPRVGKNGQVFMVQLGSGWDPGTSNLLLVVEAMVAIFAVNTPLRNGAGAVDGGGAVADRRQPQNEPTFLPTEVVCNVEMPSSDYETEVAERSPPRAAYVRTPRAHGGGGGGVTKRIRVSFSAAIQGVRNKLAMPSPVRGLRKPARKQEQGEDQPTLTLTGYISLPDPGTRTQGRKVDYAGRQMKLATYLARRAITKELELEQLKADIAHANEELEDLGESEAGLKQALKLLKQDKDERKHSMGKLEKRRKKLEAELKALNVVKNSH